jgi:four helix bundle protein
MQIGYKEAREARYWIRLLKATDLISARLADSLIADCDELIRILVAILRNAKPILPLFLPFTILSFINSFI